MEVDNDVLFPFGSVITHQRTIIGILVKLIITFDLTKRKREREQVIGVESS